MSADALDAFWDALTSKDTTALVKHMRAASAAPLAPIATAAPRMRVVVVSNDLDECFYCGAEDRFGDFNVQTINGGQRANCETCAPLAR